MKEFLYNNQSLILNLIQFLLPIIMYGGMILITFGLGWFITKYIETKKLKEIKSGDLKYPHNYIPIIIYGLFVILCCKNMTTFIWGTLFSITSYILYYYSLNYDYLPKYFSVIYWVTSVFTICTTMDYYIESASIYDGYFYSTMVFIVPLFAFLLLRRTELLKVAAAFGLMFGWSTCNFDVVVPMCIVVGIISYGISQYKYKARIMNRAYLFDYHKSSLAPAVLVGIPLTIILIGVQAWLANPWMI